MSYSKKLVDYVGNSVEIFHGDFISVYAYMSVCKVAIEVLCYLVDDDDNEVGMFSWRDSSITLHLDGDIENKSEWSNDQLADIKEFFNNFGFIESKLFPKKYYPDTKATLIHLDRQ